MKTVDFIDAIRERHHLTTDSAVGDLLGVGRASVSAWRLGRTFFDEPVCVKVAGLLDLEPGYVMACVHAERAARANQPVVSAAWERTARALRGAAAVAIAAATLFIFSPTPVHAATGVLSGELSILCQIARRWFRRAIRWLLPPFAVLALAACGGGEESPDWTGGLYGVWEPAGAARGVLIVHQGHDCFDGCRYDDSLVPLAERARDAGYLVYGFEMPPGRHTAGPVERFYQPVLSLLDTLPPGTPVYMAGLSGGGWTTTVVTALDARIVRGYSVAGIRPDPATRCDADDFECVNPPRPYEELHALAGARLLQVHIPLSNGDTCASVTTPCIEDYTTDNHAVSPWAVDLILSDMAAAQL